MTQYPYILFNKSPEQLRLLGARGGRAYGGSEAGPARPSRDATTSRPCARCVPGPHRGKHPRAGRTLSLAARCGKATVLKTASTPGAVPANSPVRFDGSRGPRRRVAEGSALASLEFDKFTRGNSGRMFLDHRLESPM